VHVPTEPSTPVVSGAGTTRSTSLATAVRAECARVFRWPFDTLFTVALNAAMMSSAWFFLPPDLVDKIFDLHGSVAFAFVLSSWMFSDVPATNVVAVDAPQFLGAVDHPRALRHVLDARRIVLWSIVAPVCILVSFVTGFRGHDLLVTLYSAVAIGVIPFGVLAVSAWVGILFPYHPVPLPYRWRNRRKWWPMLGRWVTLVLVPYAVVPALTITFLAPSLLVWGITSKSGLSKQLPDNDVGLGIALACAIAFGAVYLGQHVSLRLIACRRDKLVSYLSDPLLG
jgi:hypothetical protein